jgi:hypothetical protein
MMTCWGNRIFRIGRRLNLAARRMGRFRPVIPAAVLSQAPMRKSIPTSVGEDGDSHGSTRYESHCANCFFRRGRLVFRICVRLAILRFRTFFSGNLRTKTQSNCCSPTNLGSDGLCKR